jgi:hypothetical protein
MPAKERVGLNLFVRKLDLPDPNTQGIESALTKAIERPDLLSFIER